MARKPFTPEPGVATTRILIAEDDPAIREILLFQLTKAGYDVVQAADGKEALEQVLHTRPDLAVLDVMMPYLSGYEVCEKLRHSLETRDLPIIFLTAKSEEQDKLTGLAGGANDYITKPFAYRELLARIENLLEWSRRQRAASPLTGLPGNISINEEIARRIAGGAPFALLQLDIDFFKAFNDQYGYARGDEAIRGLASIIVAAAGRHASSFVGHIGGDDFVVLTDPDHAEPLGQEILTRFDEQVPALYDDIDRERGYIEVPNRRHVVERFPMMSITIAMVTTERVPVSHLAQLVDIAQELKAHGKGMPGSVLVGDRRRPNEDAKDADRHVA
jgi:diguanylate cyclase (GGDEF)-like protein